LPNTQYYLQYGEEEVKGQPKRPRAAAELEVKPGRNLEDQIAAVVAALLDDQKSDVLDTMKQIIGNALNEIRTWELEIEARRIMNSDDPEQADLPSRRQTCTGL
jgi:replication fork protection complex subunit Tof1/Swi1